MTNLVLLFVLALLGSAFPSVSSFAAENKFECPRDLSLSRSAKLTEIRQYLPAGNAIDDLSRLDTIVEMMRRGGLPETEIADRLIGAYCRMVAQETSMPAAEKNARSRRFAGQVTAQLRQQASSRMIVDVPLKPSVFAATISAARKDGISVDGWISRVVETELQHK